IATSWAQPTRQRPHRARYGRISRKILRPIPSTARIRRTPLPRKSVFSSAQWRSPADTRIDQHFVHARAIAEHCFPVLQPHTSFRNHPERERVEFVFRGKHARGK